MARLVPLSQPDDPRLAGYAGLTDAELRRSIEHPEGPAQGNGLFVAEGEQVIRRLLDSSYEVRSLLLTPTRAAALADALTHTAAPVFVAAEAVLSEVAGYRVHRGALALGSRRPLGSVAAIVADSRVIVVLEGVNDHENVGALFRNAAAFGVGAVLVCPRTSDPLYRRSIRVSVGHVLHVPFTRVDPWPVGLQELRALGFTLIALTPGAAATPLQALGPAIVGERVALLLGAEGPGLSDAVLDLVDRHVRVEMPGAADSLNVATTAAIALHHVVVGRSPAAG